MLALDMLFWLRASRDAPCTLFRVSEQVWAEVIVFENNYMSPNF